MIRTEKTIHYYKCKEGHISRICPDNKNRSTRACSGCGKGGDVKESYRYEKVKCYKCDQIGHLLFVCTKGESEEGMQRKKEEVSKRNMLCIIVRSKNMRKGGMFSRQ